MEKSLDMKSAHIGDGPSGRSRIRSMCPGFAKQKLEDMLLDGLILGVSQFGR